VAEGIWPAQKKTHLCPKRTKSSSFKTLPPIKEFFEWLSPEVNFELKLTERQRFARSDIRFK